MVASVIGITACSGSTEDREMSDRWWIKETIAEVASLAVTGEAVESDSSGFESQFCC